MKKEHIILLAIFLVVLHFRLIFSFQTPYFSSDDAYYNLRHTEYIKEHIVPMLYDELSYGGRYVLDSHIFHYFLAGFSFFLPPLFVFKIVPELLFAALVFIIYAIALKITTNTTAALLSSLISAFIPLFVSESLNNISVYSLVFLLLFYQIYCLLNIETHTGRFIILSFLLPFLHPFSFLLSVSFVVYAVLLNLESIRIKKLTKEAILFFVLTSILISLIIYKKAFVSFGLYAVWQNIPAELIENYFKNINIFMLIYNIGFVPLLLGILGIAFGLFREKKEAAYLLSALVLSVLILLFLRLINFYIGLVFLGIVLVIMSALSIEKAISYINMTKFVNYKKQIFAAFLLVVFLTLVVPSYFNAKGVIEKTISNEEVSVLEWAKNNTEQDATLLADISEGNYIAAIAKRKNVADTTFLLAPDRYASVYEMFNTGSLVKATQQMHKYGVDYIYLSDKTKKIYNIKDLKYIDDKCFRERYVTEKAKIYQLLC